MSVFRLQNITVIKLLQKKKIVYNYRTKIHYIVIVVVKF